EEIRRAYHAKRRADPGAGTEAQRGFAMLDRYVQLARAPSEKSAIMPAARGIRVERQGTVDQRHHRADVRAEIAQRDGGISQDARVVPVHFQGAPGELDALKAIRRGVFAAIVEN